MSRAEILYLVPYLVFLALSTGVLYYMWRRRNVAGGVAFAWYVTARTLSIFGFIVELIAFDIPSKIFWDKFQWLAEMIGIVVLPVFAVQYTEHKLQNPRRLFALSLVVPASFLLAVLTDDFHHLIYPNPQLNDKFPFPELTYDFTWLIYGIALYGYTLVFWAVGILVRRFLQLQSLPRAQIAVILLGTLIPIAGTVLSLLEINIAPQRDVIPFTSTIGNLFITWGLFRLRLFDVVPIARERVFENMTEQVIVLDALNRVIDVNQGALEILGKKNSEVLGKPADMVFAQWSDLIERFGGVNEIAEEVKAEVNGQEVYYEINISPVYDRRNLLAGRVVVVHDVTKRKSLEDGYRRLSEELEKRVKERNEELRQTAERYRFLFEQTNDAIFILDLQGRHLDANHRATDLLGYTHEEIMDLSFREISAETTQSEQVLEQLLRGEPIPVYERIFRRKNGELIPVEINVELVRDLNGNPLHIQSSVRDISERKQAEEALRKSEERFSKAFRLSPVIITITKLDDGQLIDVNETFEEFVGYKREEVIGKTTLELGLWGNPSDREQLLRILTANGEVRNKEIQFRTRDGRSITGLVSLELIELSGIQCNIAVIENITERKQADETILNQLAFDELMTRLLTRFATCSYADVDASIRIGLQEIGEFLGSDYADLFMLSEDGTAWDSSHFWSAPHLNLTREPTQHIRAGRLQWSEDRLLRGDVVKVNTLDDYPPEANLDRQFGEAEGGKSLLSVPIRGQDLQICGCIDIVSYTHTITWSDGDVARLKMVGDAIANLLGRKDAEEDLAEAYDTTLEGWAQALDLRDKETEGHSRRVTETTISVARAMGCTEEELVHVRRGSLLHDIGKMGIPDEILRKRGPLTDGERTVVVRHPITAYNLLKPIAYLEKALDIPYCHHEKWDGSGYPRGLKGEEIPLAARIFAVVDVWDALSSDRPYREAWSHDKVTRYMIAESGKHFDPDVLNIFLQMLEKGEI
jgi:PAS domain S-box-containing protein